MTREEAIKTIRELKRETNDNWYEEVYVMAIEALKAQLSAKDTTLDDVSTAYENGYKQGKFEATQKTGKWIHDGKDFPHGNDWIHCSVCGKRGINVPADLTNYCPNCGARMEEEQ